MDAPPDMAAVAAVQLPASGRPSEQFCMELQQAMHNASWAGVHATACVLPADLLQLLVKSATAIVSKEPTLVEVQPSAQQQRVTVIGDTHGQFHDLCRLFELCGRPSPDRVMIFNGDFVDRGAWGVEVLALLMAYKWLLPHNVYLIRGNHESQLITQVYGFAAELKAKYGKAAKGLFTHLKRFFASLPLSALVENSTLILHGGLFRAPPAKSKPGAKRRRSSGAKLTVGNLQDLRKASKGGQDPDPDRSLKNQVACDVLWSDPINDPGIRPNEARGCGCVFGPDITAEFLSANGLRLIIRSHEGPDARDKRLEGDKMPPVDCGYAEDHVTESGKLVTLFSAPDYPQFMADGEERYHNKAAVLHLTAPDYSTPHVETFEAVLPRPQVESYYEVPSYTDDEEDDDADAEEHQAAGSSQQGSGSQAGDDTASTATAAADAAEEVEAAAAAAAEAGISAPSMMPRDAAPPAAAAAPSGGAGGQQPEASSADAVCPAAAAAAAAATATEAGPPGVAGGQLQASQAAPHAAFVQTEVMAAAPVPVTSADPAPAQPEGEACMPCSNGGMQAAAAGAVAAAEGQVHGLEAGPGLAACGVVGAAAGQAGTDPTPPRPSKRQKMHTSTPPTDGAGNTS